MPILSSLGALTFNKVELNAQYYLFITTDSNITFNSVRFESTGGTSNLYIGGNTYNGTNPVGLMIEMNLGDNVLEYPVVKTSVVGANSTGKFYRISAENVNFSGYANTLGSTTINYVQWSTDPYYPPFYGEVGADTGTEIYNWHKYNSTYAWVLGRNGTTLSLRDQNYTTTANTRITNISGITTAGNNIGQVSAGTNNDPLITYGKHIIKCSNTASVSWQKQISDSSNITDSYSYSFGNTISLVTDSGIVMQCDPTGNIIWQKQIANANLQSVSLLSANSNIGVVGSYNNNLIYCGFANNGNILFQREISGVNLLPRSMDVTTGETYIVGNTSSNNGFLITLPKNGNLPGNIGTWPFANFTITYANTNATISTSNITLNNTSLSTSTSNSNSNIAGLFYNASGNIIFSRYGFGYQDEQL